MPYDLLVKKIESLTSNFLSLRAIRLWQCVDLHIKNYYFREFKVFRQTPSVTFYVYFLEVTFSGL